ncbi:membrane export protein [Sporocytophaga myxococcoides]|uniref:Membrane export protein n=1 Tax=Sporocytophaga myxococcoides TaxID=153721 RepID=A0A098LA46_9BACT|nr:oligosaccharide flippase family protein [Sporocytophaga myxococcoides]GAL83274.1 membrane export protein [Sporocytophaga myxococcoides]
MGIVVRQGVKGTVVTYLGVLIGAINLLWIFPKFLKPEEIGLIRVLLDIGMVVAALSQVGAGNIADRFFSHFRDEEKFHHGFLVFLLLFPLLGYLFIGGILLIGETYFIEFYQQKSALVSHYFYSIFPLAFFLVYVGVFEAYSRIHMRIAIPAFFREVLLRLLLAGIVIVYYFKLIDLDGLVFLLISTYAINFILLCFYIKFLGRWYLNAGYLRAKVGLIKEIIYYGLFIFLAGAFGLIATKIDIIILSAYTGLKLTGVYTIAFFMGTIIEIPRRSLSQIVSPLIGEAWRNNDFVKIDELYKKTSLNQLILGVLLLLLIWGNINELFFMIPNSEIYIAGKYIVLIIAISRLSDMVTGSNAEIILNSPFYKINFIIVIISGVLTIAANFILIPKYDMYGAAFATFISFGIMNFIKSYIIYKKIGLHPFTKETLHIILIGGGIFLLLECVPEIGNNNIYWVLFSIGLKSFLTIMIFIFLVYYLKFSAELNNIIDMILQFIKSKLSKR